MRVSTYFTPYRWGVAFPLLLLMLGTLLIAGGASRADVSGQAVARSAAWLLLIAAIVFGKRPATTNARPVLIFLSAAVLLVLLQIVPLPPNVWPGLPGREFIIDAGIAPNNAWRPLTIAPGATINAASSLIIPVTMLFLISSLNEAEQRWLPGCVLGFISASALVGLLQFSGAGFNNPLINDSAGQVSGTFANRNHFALYLGLGCLLAPFWAFADGRWLRWRGPVALGLVLLFALTILASGSRAGILLGALGLGIGLALSWHGVRRELRRRQRWVFPVLIAAIVSTIAIFVLISVAAGRAESIDRAFAIDLGQDMRTRALPTVLAMIETYFPVGTGFGSFDPMFRMHEPFELLKGTYFNHAHNDFLEIVLEGGLPSLLLLLAALGWWAFASVRAWRAGTEARWMIARLGSGMLLLVIVASALDYAARTPMVMAMLVIAAVWLSQGAATAPHAPLPKQDQPL